MKWIWIVLGLLVVGAVVIFWQDGPSLPSAVSAPAANQPTLDRTPVRPSRAAGADGSATPTAGPSSTSGATPSAGATTAPTTEPADPYGNVPVGRTTTTAKPAPAQPDAAPAARALPTIEHATVVPSTLERQDDGSIIADKRFRITGSGTAVDPYRVSWECLASAQESYIPRLSEDRIPERIAMLNGKVVQIDGYVTFPLLMSDSRELLLMLNQWDGCCIGVPPTPYDAVEVKLAEPAQNTQRHAGFSYGSVTGIFKIEPFLVDNWLVGLYMMENARYDADGI